MADLKPLIRLRKYRVEEKQKVLAELFREAERFEEAIEALRQQKIREQELAEEKQDYETTAAFVMFAERVRVQIEMLQEGLKKVNSRIVVAQDAMREAFGELKKIEIIQKNREDEQGRVRARKDGLVMDEIGLQGHMRKSDE